MRVRDTYRAALAGEVRAAIAKAGRKPTTVGAEAGIDRTAMSRKLRAMSPIQSEELVAIAEVLGVDAGDLLAAALEQARQEVA